MPEHEPTNAATMGKQARELLDDAEREARAARDKTEREQEQQREQEQEREREQERQQERERANQTEPGQQPAQPEPVVTTPDDPA
jgi:hypothetical protein